MQGVRVKGAGLQVGSHRHHSPTFPTLSACPVTPLALTTCAWKEKGGGKGAPEVHRCWRGHGQRPGPVILHLAGARGREGSKGWGGSGRYGGSVPGQGLEGGLPQTQEQLFLETLVRKIQDQGQHRGRVVTCKTGRKYNTVYLSTFFKALNG